MCRGADEPAARWMHRGAAGGAGCGPRSEKPGGTLRQNLELKGLFVAYSPCGFRHRFGPGNADNRHRRNQR